MEIKMQVKNFDSAIRAFKNLQQSSQKPMTDILKGGGQEIRNIAVKKIQSDPKSGRTYMRYNPTRQHKASAPGEAPATDTGYLVSQIKVKAVKPDEVVVDSQAPYSAYLELGTAEIFSTNDQHSFVKLSDNHEWKVGDMICSGISHPCTAFDKWKFIPVVNDNYDVVDGILTFF